ncbi:hypothetical protein [Catenulispora pinisilvae]|uniref:hypothetical protein n=1 Tax=Catenulispora pinisilvae TaxID=2705253 RepID=UPI001891AE34|nr:hypothetical protein [Catenulispora pinisilvae]
MTEQDTERVKALFDQADLDDVPTTRDLIGPAVAWGHGRRRRDRWTAVGVTGAVAAVAVAGVVALRPGADGAAPVGPGSSMSAPPVSPSIQRELTTLRPFLPAGYSLTCQNTEGAFCEMFVLTGPTGGTSLMQWSAGVDLPPPAGPTTLVDAVHIHKATAILPVGAGARTFANGSMAISAYDVEARNMASAAAHDLTDPAEIVYNQVAYTFTPKGSTRTYGISMSELVKELPWKNGKSEFPDDHARLGYNPDGPVLSPEQFDQMASAPGLPAALDQVVIWGNQR